MLNKIEALIHAWHYVVTDNFLHIVKADDNLLVKNPVMRIAMTGQAY